MTDGPPPLELPVHSEAPEETGSIAPGDPHLVFRVAGFWYALPASSVREVIPASQPVPIPGGPPFALGVIHHRGRIAPVLDLTRLLDAGGDPAATPSPDERYLVMQVADACFVLVAEQVAGLREVRVTDLEERDGVGGPQVGHFRAGEGLITALHPGALLEHAETLQRASR